MSHNDLAFFSCPVSSFHRYDKFSSFDGRKKTSKTYLMLINWNILFVLIFKCMIQNVYMNCFYIVPLLWRFWEEERSLQCSSFYTFFFFTWPITLLLILVSFPLEVSQQCSFEPERLTHSHLCSRALLRTYAVIPMMYPCVNGKETVLVRIQRKHLNA